jgi:hypothetical protein
MPETTDIKPISTRDRAKKLSRDDFFISIAELHNYLAGLDFDVQELESDKIEQLTPLGLAIVADYYNHKGDQQCNILVASAVAELINIIRAISIAARAKVVIIFQPTEGTGEKYFPSFHKTVIYLQKLPQQLHILHADCVHAPAIENYVAKVAHVALPSRDFIFYKQQPMLHTDGSWLHLQAGYTQCGTHALRIARKMAQRPSLLEELQIATQVQFTADHATVLTYLLPAFLAVNADSSVTRAKLLTMYEHSKDRENLERHFSKYSKYEYAGKFSHKNIEIVDGILKDCDDEDLNKRIDRADAGRYLCSV